MSAEAILSSALFISALGNLLKVSYLVSSVKDLKGLEPQVLLFANAFRSEWIFSMVVFGHHLLVLGWLAFKSGYVPKVLGLLLVVSAAGYVVDGVGPLLSVHSDFKLAAFTFIGEVVLIFWLLIKGWKVTPVAT